MLDLVIAHWDWLAAAAVGHFGFSSAGAFWTYLKAKTAAAVKAEAAKLVAEAKAAEPTIVAPTTFSK